MASPMSAMTSGRSGIAAPNEATGVGSRSVQKLLREFGSVARVRLASVEDLSRVVSRPVAARIAEHLHGTEVAPAAPKQDPAA